MTQEKPLGSILDFLREVGLNFAIGWNIRSGCGSFGRVVASDTKGPRFESSYWRNFICVFTINCIEETKIKKKRPGMAYFLKKLCKIEPLSSFSLSRSKSIFKGKTIGL